MGELFGERVIGMHADLAPLEVAPAVVDGAEGSHVLGGDGPGKNIEVGGDALGTHRLGDDGDAPLEVPTKHELADILAVLCGQRGDLGVFEGNRARGRRRNAEVSVSAPEGREGLKANVLRLAVVDQVLLLEVPVWCEVTVTTTVGKGRGR